MEEYCELYRRHNFVGTRYPHHETMVELGISVHADKPCLQCVQRRNDSVSVLFQGGDIFERLSRREKDFGHGYLTFTIHSKEYVFTIKQLESLFGFQSWVDTGHRIERKEITGLWETIGDDVKFYSARSKSNTIRSPVLRYFHCLLANVLFAREITGTIITSEMEVMVMVLKEPLGVTKNNTALIGDKSNSSSVFFLLGHLWSYKAWAVTNAKKSAKGTLCMGGLITPILLACGVPLESEKIPPKWIDIRHMRQTLSLD